MATQKLFRFGVIGVSAHSRKEWVAKARRAEALGFSTFLMWDHFNDQSSLSTSDLWIRWRRSLRAWQANELIN